MEGQGVAASAASEAGRHGEPGAGAIAAADFDDPGVTHVSSDTTDGGEGQRRNGDDTLVIPALGRPEVPGSGPSPSPASGPSSSPGLDPAPGPSPGLDPTPGPSSSPGLGSDP